MSNEIKAASFRLNEDDILKFREYAEEQGLNQAEMFESLMNNFTMAKAKGMISDRAKEIEIFQDTVNTLVGMFINSLAINQTSEERIRETLSLELNTKDKTIAQLQGDREESKINLKICYDKIDELETIIKSLNKEISKSSDELDAKNLLLNSLQEQISTLNNILTEYKSFKDENKELEVLNSDLSKEVTALTHANTDLISKIENLESMRDFYKTQVFEMSKQEKELNNSIKSLDIDYKNQIKELNLEHKNELISLSTAHKAELDSIKDELDKKYKEDLNSMIEVERYKHEAEIEKFITKESLINNKYEILKEKYDKLKSQIENKKS